jgi:hypothetical protein
LAKLGVRDVRRDELSPLLLPVFEVGGFIHTAMFERPLICDASRRPNALASQ